MNNERYIFSAYANSLGATLEKPVKAFLSEAPSAAIPITGGLVSQSQENIRFAIGSQEILRARRASTSVLGEKRGDHWVTLATSTVEGLNILDVITADLLVSRVTSVYPNAEIREKYKRQLENDNPKDNKDDAKLGKPRYFFSGSHIDGLKINGADLTCGMIEKWKGKDGFDIAAPNRQRGALFSEERSVHHIPQFGDIHVGEVDIYGGKVILTLLRVELGCPYDGYLSAAGSSTNGTDG